MSTNFSFQNSRRSWYSAHLTGYLRGFSHAFHTHRQSGNRAFVNATFFSVYFPRDVTDSQPQPTSAQRLVLPPNVANGPLLSSNAQCTTLYTAFVYGGPERPSVQAASSQVVCYDGICDGIKYKLNIGSVRSTRHVCIYFLVATLVKCFKLGLDVHDCR